MLDETLGSVASEPRERGFAESLLDLEKVDDDSACERQQTPHWGRFLYQTTLPERFTAEKIDSELTDGVVIG